VDRTKLLSVEEFPISIGLLEDRVSEICGMPVEVHNPYDGQKIFHFRVIRPQQWDNNPLHRDIWLADYDDCINLYIPVAGSNERSSLIIVPGSHLWPESRIERTVGGALINGLKYNVPAVTDIRGPYTTERPNPDQNQLLIFSPYLIHGGAVNLNKNETRISIEIRLWKK
jgi:ectoine hydroxylase-related dioxygenase (phytanoyl-CoA dioxygenase family)